MKHMNFKYVRIQGKELARNTMYAKGVFSMCMQMIRDPGREEMRGLSSVRAGLPGTGNQLWPEADETDSF